MKILTVCHGGNSRSVAMAYMLKVQGHDALACGVGPNSEETKRVLYNWADLIVLMSAEFLPWIPKEFMKKTVVVEVGPDPIVLMNYVPQAYFDHCSNIWQQIIAGWEGGFPG